MADKKVKPTIKNIFLAKHNTLILSIIDIFFLVLSYFICVVFYLFLYEQTLWLWIGNLYTILFLVAPYAILFNLFGLYRNLWQFMSFRDLFKLVIVLVSSSFIFVISSFITSGRNVTYLFFTILTSLMACNIIFISKLVYFILYERSRRKRNNGGQRIAIVGAGQAGVFLLENILAENDCKYQPICFFDDDKNKVGKNINGIKVAGTTDQIGILCAELNIDEIVIAIPSLTFEQKQRILDKCLKTDCRVVIVPSLTEMISDKNIWQSRRHIEVEDLLDRDPINLDTDKFYEMISGKTVLVTGGGGSIGSELCRQIIQYNPSKLIILDIYENSAYEIQQELILQYGDSINLFVEIATIRDYDKMEILFDKYRPELVFHAAAHKHVPLMENNPDEAVKNNIFGTYNLVRLSDKYGVLRFALISSDKAVYPTNVMGATKRFCEMIIQSMKDRSNTQFMAVRFGNVLGSNGSVIPLFKKQIERGGPVYVTSKEIIRYFMTIPEAVSLVLMSGVNGKNGSVYVLDMGAPVKIDDLARKMIILAGYVPDRDIKIEYIGLRPGEKMYEELILHKDRADKIDDKIYVEKLSNISWDFIIKTLERFEKALRQNNNDLLIKILMDAAYNGESQSLQALKTNFESAADLGVLGQAGQETAG
ncbi:MAG TPA: polysaccharide biosynthesis protein [Clostridiales bacterium]|nr:polysaccharide biosynthesis protein [Clostridiales bacterium]